MSFSVLENRKLTGAIKIIFQESLYISYKNWGGTNTRKLHKISYWHNPGSESLKQLTVGNLIDNAAEKWQTRPAFISAHQGYTLTFGEIKKQVDQLAQGLLNIGLSPGDRLGLFGMNTKEWYLTQFAAAKVGIILVNINPAFQPQELSYCMKKTNLRALAIDERFKTQHHYKMITDLIPEISTSQPKTTIFSNEFPYFNYLIVFTDKSLMGAYNYNDVQNAGIGFEEERSRTEELLQSEDIWSIQFTSGTTGSPKGASLTHFGNVNNAYFIGKRLGLHLKTHSICCQVPFFHAYGCLMSLAALIHGSTLILPGLKFKKEESVQAIKNYKCTVICGTPTMYVDLCAEISKIQKEKPDTAKTFTFPEIATTGGAICSPELFSLLQKTMNCKVVSMYGMTEAAITFQSNLDDTKDQITTTVGTVSEACEVKVVDGEGKIVPLGQPGEIWYRIYSRMLGYWEDQQKSEECITRDGWFKTGDKFILLEGGYGQIIGRIKDMIIRGGENIAPKEIEHLLETHPQIMEVQVYGVFSKRLGEEVGCSIKLTEGGNLNEDDVRNFLKGKIAHFKIPKYVEFVTDFPKTASGKIKKFQLKELMENKIKTSS